jgi:squalene synthase HpnC
VVTSDVVIPSLYSGDKNSSRQSLRWAQIATDHLTWIESVASAPSVSAAPSGAGPASADALQALERAENFPVALRILPRRYRYPLRDAYALARRIDDAGDDPRRSPQERLAALDDLAAEVRARHAGTPFEQPFLDLVAANRRDQTVTRYPTYGDLRAYCRLSAEPVGRVVLAVFGVDDAETTRLSDLVCTALQILEHCQDVVEDRRDRDRIYLPAEDLVRFGVAEGDLDAPSGRDRPASDGVRRLVAYEVDRAAALLDEGAPIVGRLHGWSRVAVAGYVAGGRATVDAIRRADHDVLSATPRPRGREVARRAVPLVCGRS